MLGIFENLLYGSLFNNPPLVHHNHIVGDLSDHPKIVRDEHHGHVVLALQLTHEIEDRGLNSNVKSRCRLVGDQKIRIAGHRHGNHHPLLLST